MQSLILKLAFVHSLCKMIECDSDPSAAKTLKNIEETAWEALVSMPGTIPFKKVQYLTIKLNKFCLEMKWEQCNVQAMLNFCLEIMEEILSHITDKTRRQCLMNVVDSLNSAYSFFTERDGELLNMIEEGLNAKKVWEEVIEKGR